MVHHLKQQIIASLYTSDHGHGCVCVMFAFPWEQCTSTLWMKLIWIRLLLLLVSKEQLQTVMHVWSSTLCGQSTQQKCLLVRSYSPLEWSHDWRITMCASTLAVSVCACVCQSPYSSSNIVSLFSGSPFLEWESPCTQCLIFCVNSTYSKD